MIRPSATLWLCLFAWLCPCAPAAAANFALAASPPRFELRVRAGEKTRQVLEITNASTAAVNLSVRTADWMLTPEGSPVFHDELAPDSCRPWVAIERRELLVASGRSYRFRFEVSPPAGQLPTECRFALMLEGKEGASGAGAPPLAGRMAVIVYVAVGEASPDLKIVGARMQHASAPARVLLQVANGGNAHGRVEGFLTAVDARGREFEANPASSPILAGETRTVVVELAPRGSAPAAPVLPLVLRGKLEWGTHRSTEIEQRVTE